MQVRCRGWFSGLISYSSNIQAGIGVADRGGSEVNVQKGLILGCEDLTSALTNNCNPHLHTLSYISARLG